MLQNGALMNLIPGEVGQGHESASFQPLDSFRANTPDSLPLQQNAALNKGMNGVANQPQSQFLENDPMDSMLMDMPDPFDLGKPSCTLC